MKTRFTFIILICICTLNQIYSQIETIDTKSRFKDKSLYYIDDSIKALVMDAHYFTEEIERRFKIANVDSVWVPSRSDIDLFEYYLIQSLSERVGTLIIDNYKNYFRQYLGIYCGNKKMILGVFIHQLDIAADVERNIHLYKSFITLMMGGGCQFFHVLFEFPDKMHKIHCNHFQ